jgi:hypothetical protein
VTEFLWTSNDHVIAIDVEPDGTRTCIEAKVRPCGAFEIVDLYELPPEQSRKSNGQKV